MESPEQPEAATNLDKVLDRIPYTSGAFRRRLICGVIFCGEILLFVLFGPSDTFLTKVSTEITIISKLDLGVLSATQVMILVIFAVYAVGAVVDVITDGFVVRGVSLVPTIIRRLPIPLKIAAGPFWPFLVIVGVVVSTFSRTKYELKLSAADDSFREALSNEALEFYSNRLLRNVQVGLNEPFGGKGEAAWQAVMYLTPDPHKSWTASLDARNRETSAFLSAAFGGTLACLFFYLFRGSRQLLGLSLFYVILWFISYLFLGYLHIVRRSIVSIVEFLAFADRTHVHRRGT
jgi:hypothetical protein